MAYGITNSSQIIDTGTISNACTTIETIAENFERCAQKIENAASICDAKALSVDKTTMQPQLEADAEYIRSIKNAICDFTVEIRNVALQIYAAQKTELDTYAANNGTTTP